MSGYTDEEKKNFNNEKKNTILPEESDINKLDFLINKGEGTPFITNFFPKSDGDDYIKKQESQDKNQKFDLNEGTIDKLKKKSETEGIQVSSLGEDPLQKRPKIQEEFFILNGKKVLLEKKEKEKINDREDIAINKSYFYEINLNIIIVL